MTPNTWTLDELQGAIQRVLQVDSPYAWIFTLKPLASPPTVVYADSGRTFEAPFSITADGTVTLGDAKEVRGMTMYFPADEVAFKFADTTDATGRVKWKGLIFRAGHFKERPIRPITADDVAAIAASVPTEGIPIHIDHNLESFLAPALESDGARLVRCWAEGDELHGEVEVPGWFAAAARDLIKSVSVGLDTSLRAIRELSFVRNPRIADAAMFSTIPAFNLFAQAHPGLAATFRPPALPDGEGPDRFQIKNMSKSLKDRLLALFNGVPADQRGDLTEAELVAAFSTTPPTPEAPAAPQGDPVALARIAQLEATVASQAATFAETQRTNAALNFYETQLRAGRVQPSQREAVLDEYRAAAIADEHQNFTADKPESFLFKLNKKYTDAAPAFLFSSVLDSSAPVPNETKFGIFPESDWEATGSPAKEAK